MIIINSWNGTGRITRNPDVTRTGENVIAKFGIAVRRPFHRDGDKDCDFFEVTAFRKTAEFIEKYGTKGMKLEISGRLQQDTWKTKDGENRSKTVIIAENVEFAESKASSGQNTKPTAEQPKSESKVDSSGFMDIPSDEIDEELPFA